MLVLVVVAAVVLHYVALPQHSTKKQPHVVEGAVTCSYEVIVASPEGKVKQHVASKCHSFTKWFAHLLGALLGHGSYTVTSTSGSSYTIGDNIYDRTEVNLNLGLTPAAYITNVTFAFSRDNYTLPGSPVKITYDQIYSDVLVSQDNITLKIWFSWTHDPTASWTYNATGFMLTVPVYDYNDATSLEVAWLIEPFPQIIGVAPGDTITVIVTIVFPRYFTEHFVKTLAYFFAVDSYTVLDEEGDEGTLDPDDPVKLYVAYTSTPGVYYKKACITDQPFTWDPSNYTLPGKICPAGWNSIHSTVLCTDENCTVVIYFEWTNMDYNAYNLTGFTFYVYLRDENSDDWTDGSLNHALPVLIVSLPETVEVKREQTLTVLVKIVLP